MKKKKSNIIDSFIKWITFLFITLLFTGYISTYLRPGTAGILSLFSLITPFLLLIVFALLLYWLLRIHYMFWVTLAVLLFHYGFIIRLYKFNGKKLILSGDVKIMSYNVRLFNRYDWIPRDSLKEKIHGFIMKKSPEIICFQEYAKTGAYDKSYPYKFEVFDEQYKSFGHAVFSKFPIVHHGSFDFGNTANNIIWVDVKTPRDTLRIYNVHLQSLGINPEKENFGQKNTGQLGKRIKKVFLEQQKQVNALIEHKKQCRYPVIICGDFNNTAFSWAYRTLSDNMQDAYVEAGKGFGRTFRFPFPLRIDFTLVDNRLEVHHFRTYTPEYSDHYPVMTRIGLPKK